MLCCLAKVKRDATKMAVAGCQREARLIQSAMAMAIKQAPGKMNAVATQHHHAALPVAHKGANAPTIQRDFDSVKSANCLISQLPCVAFITNAHIAAKVKFSGKPGQCQNGQKRTAELK